ncbi:DUF6243 family protein [Streptomyces boluensis]|uniref:Uncharacterized protein n=1 Tax=Streptomyces boluensis TaxID=1775135 RepID=A0A964XPG5_9ACTN|nr:DUF6243 family protein [Streptomyces boluensis]NBE55221.1 hypothetical protein [Streptomyces boluensis]
MAKSSNNLLGVGGQRKKLSRNDAQGAAANSAADRRSAADQKQDLLRKMRERAQGDAGTATATDTDTGTENASGAEQAK